MERKIDKLIKNTGMSISYQENGCIKLYMPYNIGTIPEICIFKDINELYFFLYGYNKCQQYKNGKIKC